MNKNNAETFWFVTRNIRYIVMPSFHYAFCGTLFTFSSYLTASAALHRALRTYFAVRQSKVSSLLCFKTEFQGFLHAIRDFHHRIPLL